MGVGVELYTRNAGIAGADEQYLSNAIAAGKRVFECVGAIIFRQDLPVVVAVRQRSPGRRKVCPADSLQFSLTTT
jgi:hypothetical protein